MPIAAKSLTAEQQFALRPENAAFHEEPVQTAGNAENLAALNEIKAMLGANPGVLRFAAPTSGDAVRQEIIQKVRVIGRAKSEITAISHPMDEDGHLDHAAGELDATVGATEVATQTILDAAERMELQIAAMAADLLDDTEALARIDHISAEIVRVMQAYSFQDITGQRIRKVVKVLRHVERHVLNIIDACGESRPLPARRFPSA